MNTQKKNLTTGFVDIDKLTTGLPGGDLILIGGRPGMGKTCFALDIAKHLVNTSDKTTIYFSMENSTQELKKMLQKKSGILPDCSSGLIIHDCPAISAKEITEICRQTENLGAIIIDYIQLVKQASEENPLSVTLKNIAVESDVPVICLVQLSRQCEARPDKRPDLQDIPKNNDFLCNITEYADLILFLYRDGYYNQDSPIENTAECIIRKNRHGDTCTVGMTWNKEKLTFSL